MAEVNPPYVLQNASHGAELFRQAISSLLDQAGGTVGENGLLVSQHEAPNMSVDILGGTPVQGAIWVPGSALPDTQGMYFCWNDATVNRVIAPADAANPRIDQVVAFVKDDAIEGEGHEWLLDVQAGTPEPGATLENGKGRAAAPPNSIVLAWVLVPAKAATIVNVDIKNFPLRMTVESGLIPQQDLVLSDYVAGGIQNLVETKEGEFEPSATHATFVSVQLSISKSGEPGVTEGLVEVQVNGKHAASITPVLDANLRKETITVICKPGDKIKVVSGSLAAFAFQCFSRQLASPVAA